MARSPWVVGTLVHGGEAGEGAEAVVAGARCKPAVADAAERAVGGGVSPSSASTVTTMRSICTAMRQAMASPSDVALLSVAWPATVVVEVRRPPGMLEVARRWRRCGRSSSGSVAAAAAAAAAVATISLSRFMVALSSLASSSSLSSPLSTPLATLSTLKAGALRGVVAVPQVAADWRAGALMTLVRSASSEVTTESLHPADAGKALHRSIRQ